MSLEQLIKDWQAETDLIIEELLNDGSDPDAEYTIEHHFAAKDFAALEKTAVDVFKAGFEVTDAEEAELDDGSAVWCFDAVAEGSLNGEQIKSEIAKLAAIADKNRVIYDGWGTYFMPEDGEEYADDEDE